MSDNDFIDWSELEDSFKEIEAEHSANAGSGREKDENGVPVWALGMFAGFMEAKEAHVNEVHGGDADACSSEEEDLETFRTKVVEPLEAAELCITISGNLDEDAPLEEQKVVIEMNGRAAFTTFMGMRIASRMAEMTGPIALMGAGLSPNMEDAHEIAMFGRALAGAILEVGSTDSDVTVVDARQ